MPPPDPTLDLSTLPDNPEPADDKDSVSDNPANSDPQPLREVSPEKLNSPKKKSPELPDSQEERPLSQRTVPQIPTASGKSEEWTKELSEILAAKRAARQQSLPNTAESNTMSRRNRAGLGRAVSLGLNNQMVETAPLQPAQPSVAENMLLSQKVVYGVEDAQARREQLLAELGQTTDEKPVDEEIDVKEPRVLKKKKPASKSRGRGKKKN
jgi:hypothetical protein